MTGAVHTYVGIALFINTYQQRKVLTSTTSVPQHVTSTYLSVDWFKGYLLSV